MDKLKQITKEAKNAYDEIGGLHSGNIDRALLCMMVAELKRLNKIMQELIEKLGI